jgi:hypothetical protein
MLCRFCGEEIRLAPTCWVHAKTELQYCEGQPILQKTHRQARPPIGWRLDDPNAFFDPADNGNQGS